jgi:crossover junction endodeoxyribonuclease RuvC
MSQKNYVGVDPGISKGGLAFIKEGLAVEYEPMPKTVQGIKAWLEFVSYMAFKEKDQIVMVVEKAQTFPGAGVVGMFNYGRHFGTFEALATAMGIPYHEVNPSVWKRAMGLTSKKVLSITLCERLFPTVNLLFPHCTVKNNHVAEAILIAEYGRRLNL